MTYKPRNWIPNSIYHITARGTHGDDIFRDETDFELYCSILCSNIKYYQDKFETYCYCLMDNHIHIVMKTKDMPFGLYFARLHGIYARYYNNKYNYQGHLFQNRYYAQLIKNDEQFLVASRYVHLNPVKASIVQKPEEYKWSSYGMIIGDKQEKLIDSSKILVRFRSSGNSRQEYKKFVESSMKLTK